jgi:predicted lipoprotein
MKYTPFAIALSLLLFLSCGGDDTAEETTPSDTFNRGAMLVNWADSIIIPGYTMLASTLDNFASTAQSFTEAPTAIELEAVRRSWLESYAAFQKVSMFEIGRAEILNYRNRLNVYPSNISEIEGFISSGSWDFGLPSTLDAQGFPAIDYVLYGIGTDQEILEAYTTHADASNYKAYLIALVATMQTLTNEVKADWENGYRETYIANTSSSASGAVDQTANAFLFHYEKALRAGKVGIPGGVFSGSPLPQNVEALYNNGISRQLLQASLGAIKNFFNGVGSGGSGASFKSYLDALNTVKNGSDLSTLINDQFEVTFTKIEILDDSFVNQIATDNSKMLEVYDELQRNVILMKVDMLQALSIDINYVDADGD